MGTEQAKRCADAWRRLDARTAAEATPEPLDRRTHMIGMSGHMVVAAYSGAKRMTRRYSPQWDKVKPGDLLYVREGLICVTVMGQRRAHYAADGVPLYHPFCPVVWDTVTKSGGAYSKRNSLPGIFMPKYHSGLILVVTAATRVEPLKNISLGDCLAEGLMETPWWQGQVTDDDWAREKADPHRLLYKGEDADGTNQAWTDLVRIHFRQMWDAIHTKKGQKWDDNGDVRVIEFRPYWICPIRRQIVSGGVGMGAEPEGGGK